VDVQAIYDGSDGEATKALYARLAAHAELGLVATNLFRAQKSSARAKVYRGGVRGQGSYRSMAYGRKNWAMTNLCTVLADHATELGMVYGWQRDAHTEGYAWVLYVELPTGQVSFHAPTRGAGPDFPGTWDGVRGASADRIVRWCQAILNDGVEPLRVQQKTETKRWLWCRHCCCFWANRSTCPVHQRALEEKARPVLATEIRPGIRAEWDEQERA
jgi:hypothetical protein